MTKIVVSAAAAWLLAGAWFLLPGMAPLSLPGITAAPSAATVAATPNASAKADRLDLKSYGAHCSDKSWPYYEPSCIRNTSTANRETKPVRIVDDGRGPYGVEFAILP